MILADSEGRWLRVSGEAAVSGVSYEQIAVRFFLGSEIQVEDNGAVATLVPISGDTGSVRHLDLRDLTGAGAYVFWEAQGNSTIRGSNQSDYISSYGGGGDRLYGYSGEDTISGGEDDDTIRGGRGADDLQGDAGEDELHGQQGDDLIDGGADFDTIVLTGEREEYDLDVVEGSYVLTHAHGDRRDGTDTFANVEALRFTDETTLLSDMLLL